MLGVFSAEDVLYAYNALFAAHSDDGFAVVRMFWVRWVEEGLRLVVFFYECLDLSSCR